MTRVRTRATWALAKAFARPQAAQLADAPMLPPRPQVDRLQHLWIQLIKCALPRCTNAYRCRKFAILLMSKHVADSPYPMRATGLASILRREVTMHCHRLVSPARSQGPTFVAMSAQCRSRNSSGMLPLSQTSTSAHIPSQSVPDTMQAIVLDAAGLHLSRGSHPVRKLQVAVCMLR